MYVFGLAADVKTVCIVCMALPTVRTQQSGAPGSKDQLQSIQLLKGQPWPPDVRTWPSSGCRLQVFFKYPVCISLYMAVQLLRAQVGHAAAHSSPAVEFGPGVSLAVQHCLSGGGSPRERRIFAARGSRHSQMRTLTSRNSLRHMLKRKGLNSWVLRTGRSPVKHRLPHRHGLQELSSWALSSNGILLDQRCWVKWETWQASSK